MKSKKYFRGLGVLLALGFIFCPQPSHAQKRAHAENWVATLVVIEGNVSIRRSGETQWIPARPNELFFAGDMIRIEDKSRAAVSLRNESTIRLDQNTTINFEGVEEQTTLINLLEGAAQFFSRIPRSLKLRTPYVNGSVQGTEFFVRVERNQTFISIFEGQVETANENGRLLLSSGQSALTKAGQAPAAQVVIRPRDAVQWALYYPPIFDWKVLEFMAGPEKDLQAAIKRSADCYLNGDITGAFKSLEGVPPDTDEASFFTYRAALLLSVGRVDEASADIRKALELDPQSSNACALQSVIVVVQNRKSEGLALAKKAVEMGPQSATARVAFSYALQANFDLPGALSSLQEATTLNPDDALAWARLSEIWLSLGYVDRAREAARKAVSLNDRLARTNTVLGFAYLADIKTKEAREAFDKAIALSPSDPLPRLGLGLAIIRNGQLQEGRREIEIAVGLDPNNALLRSYLGKAYFEEKRERQSSTQYGISKELDPLDPTPWFYDAILKDSVNRPVEALYDLQKSIELNDNRAVYRSRLLLDQDLAARSSNLGRIYNDLGFPLLGLTEGWKSVNADPSNFSAHRLLADSYAALPRHEIARVSELLQSQLLQPINISPVQPQLTQTNLQILESSGPITSATNDFFQLFTRNSMALQVNGIAGERNTAGDEVILSGLQDRFSWSIGQFFYQTNGFTDNNDQRKLIYDAFVQGVLSSKTSIQAEVQYTDNKYGDLLQRFNPQEIQPTRYLDETRFARIGMRHSFSPQWDLLANLSYLKGNFDANWPDFFIGSAEAKSTQAEMQLLFRSNWIRCVAGAGYYDADTEQRINYPNPPPGVDPVQIEFSGTNHPNFYIYTLTNFPRNFIWTLGVSADFYRDLHNDADQVNPKLGVIWNPIPSTTIRAAAFRTLKRSLLSNQTIEPTQVAGFNQFFDDADATEAWRYGFAIDQKFFKNLFGGVEISQRDLDVPATEMSTGGVKYYGCEEEVGRAYLYWMPHPWFSLTAAYQYEEWKFDNLGFYLLSTLTTQQVPLGINFFHPMGFIAQFNATYVYQEGDFFDAALSTPLALVTSPGGDSFWLLNAAIGYRLPKRFGLLSLQVQNLTDERFHFQEMNRASPAFYPARTVIGRITLSF